MPSLSVAIDRRIDLRRQRERDRAGIATLSGTSNPPLNRPPPTPLPPVGKVA
jgi:hypothetical protein